MEHRAPFERSRPQTVDLIPKQQKRGRKWDLALVPGHRGAITRASRREGSPRRLRGFAATPRDEEWHRYQH